MNIPLSREEAHRLALKFCGPPRVLSEDQVKAVLLLKAKTERRPRRPLGTPIRRYPTP